uniref:Cation/H+ exchanger domain-containing protein n=1 Tax=Acrobeloides nanus TaxID=290746 RepID=A0A914CJ43_9BILA
MIAQGSETIIFMFLGLSVVSSDLLWDTNFVWITLLGITVFRIIGVIIQCTILNRFRTKKFTFVDQFVLSYGGLRGAIAYGLVMSLPASIAARNMFMTTCIAVIYFTVLIQGMTIRPILYFLKVEKAEDKELTLVHKIYDRYFDYTMSGIEDIAGYHGKHSIRDE